MSPPATPVIASLPPSRNPRRARWADKESLNLFAPLRLSVIIVFTPLNDSRDAVLDQRRSATRCRKHGIGQVVPPGARKLHGVIPRCPVPKRATRNGGLTGLTNIPKSLFDFAA